MGADGRIGEGLFASVIIASRLANCAPRGLALLLRSGLACWAWPGSRGTDGFAHRAQSQFRRGICYPGTFRQKKPTLATPAPHQAMGGMAVSSATKLQERCEPSQNGRLAEWPQRHSATAGLSAGMGKTLPRWSTTVTGPSTRKGPFWRQRIVTLDIDRSFTGEKSRVSKAYTWCSQECLPCGLLGSAFSVTNQGPRE